MAKEDQRDYHRIITEVACRFGREHKMHQRQVNISATGIVFVVMPEMAHHFTVGEIIPLGFELNQRHFQFDTIVIRREENKQHTMAAVRYHNIDPHTIKTLDTIILSMGGYRNDDQDKKHQYLSWYAPHLLKHKPKHTPDTGHVDLPSLDSLEDMFKAFS